MTPAPAIPARSRARLAGAAALVAGLVLLAPEAAAGPDLERGERAELELRYADAVAAYEAESALASEGADAARARARLEYLRARSEGAFAPLSTLDRVRRDEARASAPAAIDELVRQAESFPRDGLVRREALLFAAERSRGARPARAAELYATVAVEAPAGDALGRHAGRQAFELWSSEGEHARAQAFVRELGGRADRELSARAARLSRRRASHLGALGVIAAFVALVADGLRRARRAGRLASVARAVRAALPAALAFGVVLGAAGGGLSHAFEAGTAGPFVALGGAVALVVVLARAWGSACARPSAVRGLLAAVSVVASALLVLEGFDPKYLEGFGL